MSEHQLDCALDLMRRLAPQQIEDNLTNLIDIRPELCDELLNGVDQPLKVAKDKITGKDYLLCDYNRDGDSYRSPWSNTYEPPMEEGNLPSEMLRKLEIDANMVFDQYREMYYEGGVSSVYLWNLESELGFAGVILIKKAGDGCKKIKGCWDSLHVFEVNEKRTSAHYKLTSTVMLWLQTNKDDSGSMNLGGSMMRQVDQESPLSDQHPHLSNIGRMVEDMENGIRSTLNHIYFGKTKDVVNGLRSTVSLADSRQRDLLKNDLAAALKNRSVTHPTSA